jgi:hypothetical protein
MHRTLVDAYAAEPTIDSSMLDTPHKAAHEETSHDGLSYEWTEEEIIRAYRESKPALRVIFDYLADYAEDHPEGWVTAPDLADIAFPQASSAVNKLYGVFGGKSNRFHNIYKKHWFIDYDRKRNPDGSWGSMIYRMPAKYVAWVKKAGGRE